MSDEFVSVTRPNGKVYTPRKPPVQISFYDEHRDIHYVAILRTHDLELARSFAQPYICQHLIAPTEGPQLGWLLHTMRDGEPWYEYDDVRGVPAVLFEESDDPDEDEPVEVSR